MVYVCAACLVEASIGCDDVTEPVWVVVMYALFAVTFQVLFAGRFGGVGEASICETLFPFVVIPAILMLW
jgi:hypothetical protein